MPKKKIIVAPLSLQLRLHELYKGSFLSADRTSAKARLLLPQLKFASARLNAADLGNVHRLQPLSSLVRLHQLGQAALFCTALSHNPLSARPRSEYPFRLEAHA